MDGRDGEPLGERAFFSDSWRGDAVELKKQRSIPHWEEPSPGEGLIEWMDSQGELTSCEL